MNQFQTFPRDALALRSISESQHKDFTGAAWKERVLLCDLNILGPYTGGQTFYANLIANHPDTLFSSLYEKDVVREQVPDNFEVLSYRPDSTTVQTVENLLAEFRPSDASPDVLADHRAFLKYIVSAIARSSFDKLDLPNYWPFVGPIKKITDRPIRLTLHGMASDGILANYDAYPQLFAYADAFRGFEVASLQQADEVVAVSQSHKEWVEQTFAPGREIKVIPPAELLRGIRRRTPLNVKDTFADDLNVLSIGRIDGIKRFHDIVALRGRVRAKHPRFIIMGMPLPDTEDLLRSMSSFLEMRPAQPLWWNQFNPDDTVVVVPGLETLSFVAVEAVAHGFTTALAPTVGAREIFDRFGISYLKLEDRCEIRPLPASVREANADALESVTRTP